MSKGGQRRSSSAPPRPLRPGPGGGDGRDAIVMKVRRLLTDPFTNLPSLLLEDASGRERLELAIGIHEAPAIASRLSAVELDRPMLHDLVKEIIGLCGVTLDRIELADLREGTFYAAVILLVDGGDAAHPGRKAEVKIDARPSDAIGLALRTSAPIHVPRKVLQRAQRLERQRARACDPTDREVAAEVGAWLLESIPDEDFGKWKM